MLTESDIPLTDGRILHVYDTGVPGTGESLTVVWHHGTPNVGAPPSPLFAASERLGIRWVSYDRPGYGTSTERRGRDVASAAADVAAVADAVGIDRFAVMGHSGGAPHALACAALLPERVLAVVGVAALAPPDAAGLDWFAGMAADGASLRAAAAGRAEKERYEALAEFDPAVFTEADHAALAGPWSWVLDVVRAVSANGSGPLIDDDTAYITPWGFDPAQVEAPVLLLHGAQDRIAPAAHAEWLAECLPAAELRMSPEDGHISILSASPESLDWLRETTALG